MKIDQRKAPEIFQNPLWYYSAKNLRFPRIRYLCKCFHCRSWNVKSPNNPQLFLGTQLPLLINTPFLDMKKSSVSIWNYEYAHRGGLHWDSVCKDSHPFMAFFFILSHLFITKEISHSVHTTQPRFFILWSLFIWSRI